MFELLRRWLNRGPKQAESRQSQSAAEKQPIWLPASNSTWDIAVLDARPVTLAMISTSTNPEMARNAVSYHDEDGTAFSNATPAVSRKIEWGLKLRTDGNLLDGPLFVPSQMEDKWAIFFSSSQILFIRSWTRQLVAVAKLRLTNDDEVELTHIVGAFGNDEGEPEELTRRIAEFLIKTHALGLSFPAPLPTELYASPPRSAALWLFTMFGRQAQFGAGDAWPKTELPAKPMRTYSSLHIAAVRSDVERATQLLLAGARIDARSPDGLTPLHWACLSKAPCPMVELLLQHGVYIDTVGDEGTTPLMLAVETKKPDVVEQLLKAGANTNAQDFRGFTALHRAAEMGEIASVRLLRSFGARSDIDAQGHTAVSLARHHNRSEIAALLSRP